MKVFAYVVEKRPNRTRNNRCARIYRIVKNLPKYIGYTEYSTGSTMGDDAEVFHKLIEMGLVPKSYYNLSETTSGGWCGAGYYCQAVEDKGYKIVEMF